MCLTDIQNSRPQAAREQSCVGTIFFFLLLLFLSERERESPDVILCDEGRKRTANIILLRRFVFSAVYSQVRLCSFQA